MRMTPAGRPWNRFHNTRWRADSAYCRPTGYPRVSIERISLCKAIKPDELRPRCDSNYRRPETHGDKSAKPRPPATPLTAKMSFVFVLSASSRLCGENMLVVGELWVESQFG